MDENSKMKSKGINTDIQTVSSYIDSIMEALLDEKFSEEFL